MIGYPHVGDGRDQCDVVLGRPVVQLDGRRLGRLVCRGDLLGPDVLAGYPTLSSLPLNPRGFFLLEGVVHGLDSLIIPVSKSTNHSVLEADHVRPLPEVVSLGRLRELGHVSLPAPDHGGHGHRRGFGRPGGHRVDTSHTGVYCSIGMILLGQTR